jgi:hypothetical protein
LERHGSFAVKDRGELYAGRRFFTIRRVSVAETLCFAARAIYMDVALVGVPRRSEDWVRFCLSTGNNKRHDFHVAQNGMHWTTLHMVFDEDQCRVRVDNAKRNFVILRRVVMNLLRQDRTTKRD